MTLDTTARNRFLDAIMPFYEGGTLVIRNSSNATLATINVPGSAFSSASGGTAELSSSLQATVTASGTAHNYVCNLDGGGTESGSIVEAPSSGDMVLDDISLEENGTVTIVTWNTTLPAS